jgi:RimJ/RimL family protein N-acetyltransferase
VRLDLPAPPLVDAAHDLCLRPWGQGPHDAAALASAWADPALRPAPPGPGSNTGTEPSLAAARRWIQAEPDRRSGGRALDLVVARFTAPEVVWGEVGLRDLDMVARRAQVGWWIGAPHRGRGRGTVAVRLLADWALGRPLALHQLWARIEPANAASGRLAERAGFRLVGRASDGVDVWARHPAILIA